MPAAGLVVGNSDEAVFPPGPQLTGATVPDSWPSSHQPQFNDISPEQGGLGPAGVLGPVLSGRASWLARLDTP